MRRVTGADLKLVMPFVQAAADEAAKATCLRDKCGSAVVSRRKIIGRGYNSPPLDDEANRQCNKDWDYSRKPKADKTCCVHAEWRAVLEAAKTHPKLLNGSTLYFMRIDKAGRMTDASEPYCTECSRLILDNGISEVALWNNNGVDLYEAQEYNRLSYKFHELKQ